MSTTATLSSTETQYATFYVADLLLGLPLSQVREIINHQDVTAVPHAPPFVRGVINLRGEVVTVVDHATLLDLPQSDITAKSRTVIVNWDGDQVGLTVDSIADIISIPHSEITPPPSNINGADGRRFRGVYTTENHIVVIVKLDDLFASYIN
ncbi:MAG: chemotaxis protein CheW [Pirellulales bacterium]|nr:chemotaxis protein CheW [Pirellulales bacterium]